MTFRSSWVRDWGTWKYQNQKTDEALKRSSARSLFEIIESAEKLFVSDNLALWFVCFEYFFNTVVWKETHFGDDCNIAKTVFGADNHTGPTQNLFLKYLNYIKMCLPTQVHVGMSKLWLHACDCMRKIFYVKIPRFPMQNVSKNVLLRLRNWRHETFKLISHRSLGVDEPP
jgi:hypothetical protein